MGGIFQSQSSFSYVLETSTDEDLYINVENVMIEENFGIQNSIVVMVPRVMLKRKKNYLLIYLIIK